MDINFQSQDMIYVIYSGIVVGILLVMTGATQLLNRRENRGEAKSRRMRMIAGGKTTDEVLAVLKPQVKGGPLSRLPFIGNLPSLLLQAGLTIKPALFVTLCTCVTLITFVVGLTSIGLLQAVPTALAIGYVIPLAAVHRKRAALSEALVKQLPDALDLMARGLKVGHPLNTSIGAVAHDMEDPIATEFGIVFDQVSFGDDLTDAFQEFAERVDLEDVSYLSASIGIQHGTGGDLASVIRTLSNVIRSRISMRRKIHAISSEGRLSAWILSALPLVIFGFTSVSSPDYYGGIVEDPLFVPMCSAVVGFTVLNFIVLRKLVNFRI